MPICMLAGFQKFAPFEDHVFKMLNAIKNGLLF